MAFGTRVLIHIGYLDQWNNLKLSWPPYLVLMTKVEFVIPVGLENGQKGRSAFWLSLNDFELKASSVARSISQTRRGFRIFMEF